MKTNNCKLCEKFDTNQKLSGGLNSDSNGKSNDDINTSEQPYCRHSLNSDTLSQLNFLTPHIRGMFLAAEILRGNHLLIFTLFIWALV